MLTQHERTAIRHYVVDALGASRGDGHGNTIWATDCQARVYPDLITPLRITDATVWPQIAVYTPDEVIDEKESTVCQDADNPGHLKRHLLLYVAIFHLAEEEDSLDKVALQVERVIDLDPSFPGKTTELLFFIGDVLTLPEGVTSPVVKSANGGTSYSLTTDYTLAGSILTRVAHGAIAANQQVLVQYTRRLIDSVMLSRTPSEFQTAGETNIAIRLMHYVVTYRTPTRTADPVPDPLIDEVFVSWAPEIGIPHKDEYVELTNTGRPKV